MIFDKCSKIYFVTKSDENNSLTSQLRANIRIPAKR